VGAIQVILLGLGSFEKVMRNRHRSRCSDMRCPGLCMLVSSENTDQSNSMLASKGLTFHKALQWQ